MNMNSTMTQKPVSSCKYDVDMSRRDEEGFWVVNVVPKKDELRCKYVHGRCVAQLINGEWVPMGGGRRIKRYGEDPYVNPSFAFKAIHQGRQRG